MANRGLEVILEKIDGPCVISRLSGLRSRRLFATSDLDAIQLRVSRILQPFGLTVDRQRKDRRAHVDSINLGSVRLNAMTFGEATVRIPEMAGLYVLFCLRGSAAVESDTARSEIGPRVAAVLQPGDRFAAQFSPSSEHFVMRVAPAALSAYSPEGRMTSLPRELDLGDPALRSWVGLLQHLVDDAPLVDMLARHPATAAHYEALLVQSLYRPSERHRQRTPQQDAGPLTVREAQRFIAENLDGLIDVTHLAEAVGVSERTLQRAFERYRGTTPMRHVRDMRLDNARRQLADPANARSVTEVALSCGFNHLSRFSQVYLSRFAERPSQTLRRAERG